MVGEVNKQVLRKGHQILRLDYPVHADSYQSSRNVEEKWDCGKNSAKPTNLDIHTSRSFR